MLQILRNSIELLSCFAAGEADGADVWGWAAPDLLQAPPWGPVHQRLHCGNRPGHTCAERFCLSRSKWQAGPQVG